MTLPRDSVQRPLERGPGGGRSPRPAPAPTRRAASPGFIVVALISVLALLVAGAALFATLTRPVPVAQGSCGRVAWDALPASDVLPEGWTISGTGFFTDGYAASLAGPAPSGAQTAPPAMNVRVSCYGTDGHLALTRSHASDLALGGSDVPFADVGDEALAAQDANGTTTSAYIRRGRLVASIAAQSVSAADLEDTAAVIDDAMIEAEATAAKSASAAPSATGAIADPTDEIASDEPEPTAAHEFPDLEAVLTNAVPGAALSTESATAAEVMADDPTDPAFQWLTGVGKTPADLEVAEGSDSTSTLYFFALRVKGIASARLRQEFAPMWIGADPADTTQTNKTIGGKAVLVIDYGDQGALDYVFEQGDVVVILSSADPALVERILSGLK